MQRRAPYLARLESHRSMAMVIRIIMRMLRVRVHQLMQVNDEIAGVRAGVVRKNADGINGAEIPEFGSTEIF